MLKDIFNKEKLYSLFGGRRHLVAFAAGFAGICLLIWLIIHFMLKNNTGADLYSYIPDDAAFILEVRKPNDFRNTSLKSDLWIQSMRIGPLERIEKGINIVNEELNKNSYYKSGLNDIRVIISFHKLAGKWENIFAVDLQGYDDEKQLSEVAKVIAGKGSVVSSRTSQGVEIFDVNKTGQTDKFGYFVREGLFVGSFSSALLDSAIYHRKNGGNIGSAEGYKLVQNTAGKKVEADLYVNFSKLNTCISEFANDDFAERIKKSGLLAGWAEMDIYLDKQKLQLNGFCEPGDTLNSFLWLFHGLQPGVTSMQDVLPANTGGFVYYNFGDFDSWYSRYYRWRCRSAGDKYSIQIGEFEKKNNLKVQSELLPIFGKELSIVTTEADDTAKDQNVFAVVKTDNIETAKLLLLKYVKQKAEKQEKENPKPKKKKNKKKKTSAADEKPSQKITSGVKEVKSSVIYEFGLKDIFPVLFGSIFKNFESNYILVWDDYLVFASERKGLKKYLSLLEKEQTLSSTDVYRTFFRSVSAESNIFIYLNFKKSLDLIKNASDVSVSDYIENNRNLFSGFDAVGFQFKTNGSLFYFNGCFSTFEGVASVKEPEWSVSLDTTVYGRPQFVDGIKPKSKYLVVFDQSPAIYLADKKGKILWQKKLNGKPLGEALQVDINADNKKCLIFNTSSSVYLINLDGKDIKPFPVSLTAKSTAPLSVADYTGKKDYRILVPCGKTILNLNKNGDYVSGWEFENAEAELCKPAKHLVLGGSDCIVFSDVDGNIYIRGRKGETFVQPKSKIKASLFNSYFISSFKEKKYLMTTNEKGNLVLISSGGDVIIKTLKNYSASHFLLFDDLNNDNKKEVIIADSAAIDFYNNEYVLKCTYGLPGSFGGIPGIYRLSEGKNYLGVYCLNDKKIYLIDSACKLAKGFPVEGSSSFAISAFEGNKNVCLVYSDGSLLSCYSLQKE